MQKEGKNTQIRIENQGDFDRLLRKFRRQIIREGVLADVRRHEAYVKPSVRRKQKEAKARRRARMSQRYPRGFPRGGSSRGGSTRGGSSRSRSPRGR